MRNPAAYDRSEYTPVLISLMRAAIAELGVLTLHVIALRQRCRARSGRRGGAQSVARYSPLFSGGLPQLRVLTPGVLREGRRGAVMAHARSTLACRPLASAPPLASRMVRHGIFA